MNSSICIKKINNLYSDDIKELFYIHERYKIPLSFALIKIDEANDKIIKHSEEMIQKGIRFTDVFKKIDNNIYLIFYMYVELKGALVSLKRIMHQFDMRPNYPHIYIGINEFKNIKDEKELIRKTVLLLEDACKSFQGQSTLF